VTLGFSANTSVLQILPAMVKVVCCSERATRLVPQLGTGTNAWVEDILKSNSRFGNDWWLNPECIWKFSGPQFSKTPHVKLHSLELLSVYSCYDCAPLVSLCTTGTSLSSTPDPSPPWGEFLWLLVVCVQ